MTLPSPRLADLSDSTVGVFPHQLLSEAVQAGYIDAGDLRVRPESIQPASLDLRLGETALRIRCSFLPDDESVDRKVKDYIVDELDLRKEGAVLESEKPYLIPLAERLRLPPHVRGKTNPRSSTGRLDVFTRVVTDHSYRFDEIAPGYDGDLYLEVVPLSFPVRVREGLSLNQLRLMIGQPAVSDEDLWQRHERDPILYRHGRPATRSEFATSDGLFLSLDLHGGPNRRVGYRAKQDTKPLDMTAIGSHRVEDYWDPIQSEEGDRVVLSADRFYLLLSEESVRVPPDLAAEMTAYDPTSGELRTHYAGFFDPGFGFSRDQALKGSRAALEVRAHNVPFMIEHGQRVCKLTFEPMISEPTKLYGQESDSNYQAQFDTLGKHFRTEHPQADGTGSPQYVDASEQPSLFASEDDAAGP